MIPRGDPVAGKIPWRQGLGPHGLHARDNFNRHAATFLRGLSREA